MTHEYIRPDDLLKTQGGFPASGGCRGRKYFVAVDLGATSGRVMIDGGDGLREIHRFQTPMVRRADGIYWDFEELFSGVISGLAKVDPADGEVVSLSCDSWAQDFGMLDAEGALIADPISYRDRGSAIHTGSRLEYIREKFPERFRRADRILHIADLVHYRLCGAARSNYTLAAVGRMPPDHPLLSPPADGEIIGRVDHAALPALRGVPVISGAGHDTAAAFVSGAPAPGEVMISVGTWLMAAEPWDPEKAIPSGFGILPLPGRKAARTRGGMGLWPFQQCVKLWNERGDFPGYETLDAEAAAADDGEYIDPDTPELYAPENMEQAIFKLVGKRLSVPETAARLFRGLARRTALTVEAFGTDFRRAILVGGGAGSARIRQLIAGELKCPTAVGETEASAAGNIAVQKAVMGKAPAGWIPARL